MEQIVVHSEDMGPNREILLFYVDENGEAEEGGVATIQHIDQNQLVQNEDGTYLVPEIDNLQAVINEAEIIEQQQVEDTNGTIQWTDEETKRLLTFYIDNKKTFFSGATKSNHLWSVACKAILNGKNPTMCEVRMRFLKKKFATIFADKRQNSYYKWNLYGLCYQAFHDDKYIQSMLHRTDDQKEVVVSIQKVPPVNPQVEQMLKLFLKYKNRSGKQSEKWELIASELGEGDAEYWSKRFYNYKQHYIVILEKRQSDPNTNVTWPYLSLFDQIYENDTAFQEKYGFIQNIQPPVAQETQSTDNLLSIVTSTVLEWNDTEKTVLIKYCFDCFDEFQDPTIPRSFFWNEIGRLLDKKPNECKDKYNELKGDHLDLYLAGEYDIRQRKPIAILFDNIISREIQLEFSKAPKKSDLEMWKTELIDEMVKFFYENTEVFKDPICHFVCWAAIATKLGRSVYNCWEQWKDLAILYNTILEDKKENPDMQIDWRYIEIFDRIFDYGMDTCLLQGYDKQKQPKLEVQDDPTEIEVSNVDLEKLEDELLDELSDTVQYDERGSVKQTKKSGGDAKAFKILEYYNKNKDKFSSGTKKKNLWDRLAHEIGLTPEQCAHRFRNLKQVYIAYLQREVNKPEMPILWPYYSLCKKVFGYRAIKNKLKSGKPDYENEEWTAKEIKSLIRYVSQNFFTVNNNPADLAVWLSLALEVNKSKAACREKFLELRKSYRKLKTMKTKNPNCDVIWKYYKMFDELYTTQGGMVHIQDEDSSEERYEALELPEVGGPGVMEDETVEEMVEEDDYQCIIVIPEGEDITNLSDAQIVIQSSSDNEIQAPTKKATTKWTKLAKKRLLIHYLNYIKAHKGKEIEPKHMWKEISSKLKNKRPRTCRLMYNKIKKNLAEIDSTSDEAKAPLYTLMAKIKAIKPKFMRKQFATEMKEDFKDVTLPDTIVLQALQYYLQNIDDFLNPRFEKSFLWTQLANEVSAPVSKLYNKVNFLRRNFNVESETVCGIKPEFSEILKEILQKEKLVQSRIDSEEPMAIDETTDQEEWSDDEIEQLLMWYLQNLDQFKNPKLVRKFLWVDASKMLGKTPVSCSKKMSEIRTQYSSMVKESPEALNGWRFHDLCQKIYGTGKKHENK